MTQGVPWAVSVPQSVPSRLLTQGLVLLILIGGKVQDKRRRQTFADPTLNRICGHSASERPARTTKGLLWRRREESSKTTLHTALQERESVNSVTLLASWMEYALGYQTTFFWSTCNPSLREMNSSCCDNSTSSRNFEFSARSVGGGETPKKGSTKILNVAYCTIATTGSKILGVRVGGAQTWFVGDGDACIVTNELGEEASVGWETGFGWRCNSKTASRIACKKAELKNKTIDGETEQGSG